MDIAREFDYLGSPYSHKDPFVREYRYLQAMQRVSHLLKNNFWVYSPIVHCHELKKIVELPHEHDFWLAYDLVMLEKARALQVLCLPNWQDSLGLGIEIRHAKAVGKPIYYVEHPLEHIDLVR